MATKNKEKIDTPSVLAFEKKLVPSDGYFYGTNWIDKGNVSKLKLIEKSLRGTISNRMKSSVANDPAKLNAEVKKANLQTVDVCSLSPEQDTLNLQFTLKVLGGLAHPSACNNHLFKGIYAEAVKNYIDKNHFNELGKRYACNIANARFLWRNRVGVENIEVNVKSLHNGVEKSWSFNATEIGTKDFNTDNSDVISLGQSIANVLSSEDDFILLEINCFSQIGRAQEVYPSEELILDKGNNKNKKSKILYAVEGNAAMHSQKIGNALRNIDTWYPEYINPLSGVGPISVEPYGSVTNLGKAFRTPKEKNDFFTLFDKWVRGDLDEIDSQHYVLAVLVRGGVFGERAKKD